MSYSRIAAVTGANKGIGLAIVRQLALQYPKSPLNTGPLLIYLTARDPTRGADAVAALQRDPALLSAKALSAAGGLSDIKFARLDISDETSIRAFADFLRAEHPDGIDIVVNNASIALEGFDASVVEQTLRPNYYGTVDATRTLLPLVRPGGRIVNVTSSAGALSKFSPSLQSRFRGASTVADVDALMAEFHATVAAAGPGGDLKGWPGAAYAVSKAGATAATRVIAREAGGGVLVNACCPGWVKTDMTKGRGFKTPDRGAQTPVMLALEDIGGRSGLFWRDEKVIEP